MTGRHWTAVVIGILSLLLAGALVVGAAVWLVLREDGGPATAGPPTVVPPTVDLPTDTVTTGPTGPTGSTGTDTETCPEPLPDTGHAGDLDDPHPAGSLLDLPMGEGECPLTVQLGAVNWSAADVIHRANPLTPDAPEGYVYITVMVSETYWGPDEHVGYAAIDLHYVNAWGIHYLSGLTYTPVYVGDQDPVTFGGTITYELVLLIPAGDDRSGAFEVLPRGAEDGSGVYTSAREA
jgi:hypothetical protein